MQCPICEKAELIPVALGIDAPLSESSILMRAMKCPESCEGIIEDSELRRAVGEPERQKKATE
jgi:hypothetical protein